MNDKFVTLLKEESDESTKQIEQVVRKYFKDSLLKFSKSSLGGQESLFVVFTLGKGKDDYVNGIPENDRAFTRIAIHPEKSGGFTSSMLQGNLMVRPKVKSHLAYERVKMGWQDVKKGQSLDKTLKNMDKYFSNLKNYLDANPDALD
jgi:hypothetical protein